MVKNSQNQTGSALVVVIIIFIVLIIGALGYVIWDNYRASKNDNTQQLSTEKNNINNPEDQNEGYVKINEWAVRFRISDDLASTKVVYYSRSTEDSPPQDYFAFTTSRIKALGGKCTEQQFGDTVMLYRYNEKPIATPDGELVNESALNGYYYVLTSPIASCSGFDENGEMKNPSQNEVDDRAALKASIRKLELSEQ